MRFIILTFAMLAFGCSKNTNDANVTPTPIDPSTTLTGEHLEIFKTLDGNTYTYTYDGTLYRIATFSGLNFKVDVIYESNATKDVDMDFEKVEGFWLNENSPRLNYINGIDTVVIGINKPDSLISVLFKHGTDLPGGYWLDLY